MKKTTTISIILFFLILSAGWLDANSSSSFGNNSAVPVPILAAAPLPIPQPHRLVEGCHFPQHWTGSWFQSGVHQSITISRSAINIKGRCVEVDGEKYLLHNERDNCYRCVVFHEKHHNLIQYKETFCVPPDRSGANSHLSISKLCPTITGDANLFAMFRMDASPIDCPFRAPLSFTYNRGQGECRNPVSTVDSCIDSTRLLFNYQACPDVPGTESTTEELQCLASWKEGSSRYLIGLIQYRHHASYEERFRCFVYEKVKKGMGGSSLLSPYSNNIVRTAPLTFNYLNSSTSAPTNPADSGNSNIVFRVSQSGDATCNGLTPYEGSRTMTLRRAQPTKQFCHFPSWLQIHPRWHTLDSKTTVHFNSTNMRVTGTGESRGGGGSLLANILGKDSNHANILASCSQILEGNGNKDNDYTIILHITTNQCLNGYICSRIVRRDTHIFEMQMGSALTRRQEEACHSSNFNRAQEPYTTFTSSNSIKKRCPSLGHFGITSLSQEGRSLREASPCKGHHGRSLSVGCSSRNTLEMRTTCNSNNKNDNPPLPSTTTNHQEYACHGWWEEDGLNYLITTTLTPTSTSRKFCFVYRDITPTSAYRQNQNQNNNNQLLKNPPVMGGRMLQFSTIAESCRRDVSPGIEGFLAFNVTSIGGCSDISGSSSSKGMTELWPLAIILYTTSAAAGGIIL